MQSRIRRLADLTLVEQVLLLQLTVLSLAVRVLLLTMTLSRLASFLSRTASSPLLSLIPLFQTHCPTDRLLMLIDVATAVSHQDGRCLPRSLLLFWLLRTNRRSVSLCLGVSKTFATLEGHAWVEQDGVVLGDTPSFTNRYALLLRLPA
jgi:hypothetical protein